MLAFLRKLFGIRSQNQSATALQQQNAEEENIKSSPSSREVKSYPPARAMNMKKFLIVGLGNIGPKYENTRHNIGFKMVDYLASAYDASWETAKLGDITSFKKKGRTFFLLKPSTYMNLSGKAVKYWLEKEKIPKENLFVITDDLNLPFGSIRVKTKGSDGGHNGLKDIQLVLQTTQYNRFRFGISDAFSKGRQVDYVLSEWTSEETEKLKERFEMGTKVVESFGLAGIQITMNTYNGK